MPIATGPALSSDDAKRVGFRRQGLRTLHRVSVKGAPAASLPRDDEEGWLAEHTRGYRTPLEPGGG